MNAISDRAALVPAESSSFLAKLEADAAEWAAFEAERDGDLNERHAVEEAAWRAEQAALVAEIDGRIARRARISEGEREAEAERQWQAAFEAEHGHPWSKAWQARQDAAEERRVWKEADDFRASTPAAERTKLEAARKRTREAYRDIIFAAHHEEQRAELASLLSIETWTERAIPEPRRLLGDLLTTTTRVFLVGRTGLGKTMLALGIAAGVASGTGFLQWPAGRPARVMYLDGEMPAELIKPRARDAVRRLKVAKIPPGHLLIFGRDVETEARRVCPTLPPFEPLNTEGGRKFLLALIEAVGGVELIIFDNVMSLVSGDQKDEVPWSETMPLVMGLTDRRIGQLWLDHTGHNSDRQYGSSTKAWRFDAVGVMAPLPGNQADPRGTAFTLSFDHPGKARRRTPDNWQQFATQTIRLVGDDWTFAPSAPARTGDRCELKPAAEAHYRALQAAVGASAAAGSAIIGAVTREAWYAECVRQGLADAIPAGAGWRDRDRMTKTFRARLAELKAAGWIEVQGDLVTDIKARTDPHRAARAA